VDLEVDFAKRCIYPLNPKAIDSEHGPSILFEELDDDKTFCEENDPLR